MKYNKINWQTLSHNCQQDVVVFLCQFLKCEVVVRFVDYGGIVDQLSSHKKSSHKVVFRKFE